METFSALLAICAGNSPVTGEFLAQRPVTRSFDVFFDLRLNERLSKQLWGWWFDLRRHHAHYDVTVMQCFYLASDFPNEINDRFQLPLTLPAIDSIVLKWPIIFAPFP